MMEAAPRGGRGHVGLIQEDPLPTGVTWPYTRARAMAEKSLAQMSVSSEPSANEEGPPMVQLATGETRLAIVSRHRQDSEVVPLDGVGLSPWLHGRPFGGESSSRGGGHGAAKGKNEQW